MPSKSAFSFSGIEPIERGYQVLHHGVACFAGDTTAFVRR
jgi:hypothetical protein